MSRSIKRVLTPVLEIGYEESGPADGQTIILMHGWPDDVRAYDAIAPALAAQGHRVLVPYLRGYGPTRFLDPSTPRSGQQAALGSDLKDFIDALGVASPVLAGYDWGGRAAVIVSALWPQKVKGLVSVGGYSVQDIAKAAGPSSPEQEYRFWYHWYFHTERGRTGLRENRRALTKLLWELWSPNWRFGDATLDATVASFENPDFVDITIHSYRHRYGNAPGDAALEPIEKRLAARPVITVPAVVLHGGVDGVTAPPDPEADRKMFTAYHRRHVEPNAGHFFMQEAPRVVIDAVGEVLANS